MYQCCPWRGSCWQHIRLLDRFSAAISNWNCRDSCRCAVTINSLLVSFAIRWWSTVSPNWLDATVGGAVLGLTAAPFWFIGALVLYGFVERRLLDHTHRDDERTGPLSALIAFFWNPSTSATKVANPLTWACYLFVCDLFLSLLLGFFVVVPLQRYFGATFIGNQRHAGP